MNKIEASAFSGSGSLHGQVFMAIENAILSGALLPGDALAEVKLSQELGVSRTPVREAIRQLELEGLVKSILNRGAVVVGVSERDIEDIYTIRMRIEGLAACWASSNITTEEREQLQNIMDLQEFYLEKGDVLQIWHLDSRFHELIHQSCRSNPLKHTLSSFHHYIQKARRMSFENITRAQESVLEHKKIVQAIMEGNGNAADRLMIEHIKNAKDNFLKHIKGS